MDFVEEYDFEHPCIFHSYYFRCRNLELDIQREEYRVFLKSPELTQLYLHQFFYYSRQTLGTAHEFYAGYSLYLIKCSVEQKLFAPHELNLGLHQQL